MVQKNSKVICLRISLIISQIMSIVFLITNTYVFINHESIIAKSLTVISFIIFLFLLILSLMATLNLKKLSCS